MSPSEARIKERKALGDYANANPNDKISKAMFFYPWLKTIVPLWTHKMLTKPQFLTAPAEGIRCNNKLRHPKSGDRLPDYALDVGTTKAGRKQSLLGAAAAADHRRRYDAVYRRHAASEDGRPAKNRARPHEHGARRRRRPTHDARRRARDPEQGEPMHIGTRPASTLLFASAFDNAGHEPHRLRAQLELVVELVEGAGRIPPRRKRGPNTARQAWPCVSVESCEPSERPFCWPCPGRCTAAGQLCSCRSLQALV